MWVALPNIIVIGHYRLKSSIVVVEYCCFAEAATEEQKRLLLLESSMLRGMQQRNLLSLKHVVLDSNDCLVPMAIFPFKEGIE